MATILENEAAWSTTAATNANVDTGVNWVEGQDAATVNNSARGMMAARKKATLDLCGGLTAGGSANALTVTTNQVLSAAHLAGGLRLAVYSPFRNTSTAVTLAVDGLTPTPIHRSDGSALAAGSIPAGMWLDLLYMVGTSDFRALNILPSFAPTNAFLAAFQIHNNNVDFNTGTTAALLGLTTLVFNNGSYYTPNRWTPPAGYVSLQGSILWSSTGPGALFLYLYKNGGLWRQTIVEPAFNTYTSANISTIEPCNGSDYFEFYVKSSTSCTVSGTPSGTWLSGVML